MATLAHELKHAYQFWGGKISFTINDQRMLSSGILNDATDEAEASRRGYAFRRALMHQYNTITPARTVAPRPSGLGYTSYTHLLTPLSVNSKARNVLKAHNQQTQLGSDAATPFLDEKYPSYHNSVKKIFGELQVLHPRFEH